MGLPLPPGDVYEVDCVAPSGKRVELARGTVKSLFAASLNAAKPFMRWPEDLRAHSCGLPVSTALAAIKQRHEAIADLFGKDLGQIFVFTESSILIDVLLKLGDQEITTLPVHDCILVAESAETIASQVMLDAFTLHTGQSGRGAVERASEV